METIKIDISKTLGFVSQEMIDAYSEEIKRSNIALHKKTGRGNDFVGWVELPSTITDSFMSEVEASAKKFSQCDVVVVIGIGGSYLGSKAVIDSLSHSFATLMPAKHPVIVFAGQNIGEDYTAELLELLETKKYGIVVISKSGTTTEPAVAFRIFKAHLEKKVGKEASKNLIVAITDEKRGALRTLATREGYQTFVIPDDVGGRYSVLTPVGLLPIAISGFNIREFVKGMQEMQKLCGTETDLKSNPAAIYAAARNALYKKGKKVEILANYNQKLVYISEWWKQLYGESEGKENVGIFPASVNFTADLHSMGQYIQEGERHIFETVITVKNPNHTLTIPEDKDNLDGMNFIAGKRIDAVNKMAELGTLLAHVDGGVPNIKIELPAINERYIGQLLYFFEIACGISGYLLGVNPFDQPGVEAYKKNMFALLDKPGFEEEGKKLRARI